MDSFLPTFCSLAQVIDWAIARSASRQCVFHLVKARRLCANDVNCKVFDQARLDVAEQLERLCGPPGSWADGSLEEFLHSLASKHLCYRHKDQDSHAIVQWQQEFTTERAAIIAKVKEYKNFEIDDTRAWESEDDTDDVDASGNDEEEPADEESTSAEEDDVSGPSRQSSPPSGLVRRTASLAEDEVAKEVTYLLEQPARKRSKKPGWIYAICPNDLPGMVKVGFTLDPPELQRLRSHDRCHRGYEVLTTRLIPYAYRVEQLLFKEFSNEQYELENGCRRCDKHHGEFLHVDKATLLTSLEKWICFVETFPYNSNGNLKKEAKERLPRPALKSYLGCRLTRGRRSTSLTPREKGRNQGYQTAFRQRLGFKLVTPATKHLEDHEAELDDDDLCSAVEDLQLTPSKNKRAARRS